MIVRALTVFAVLAGIAASAPCRAEGSVAVGRDGRTGISYNLRRSSEADERAMRECGGSCRVVGRFERSCAAVATGRGGGYGWARRERLGQAERAAVENCVSEGNRGCSVSVRGCDDR